MNNEKMREYNILRTCV